MSAEFMLIGEATAGRVPDEIVRFLVERAGDEDSRIAILPTACPNPSKVLAYVRLLKSAGAREVYVVKVLSRDDAMDRQKVRQVDDATCVVFLEGSHERVIKVLDQTPLYRTLVKKLDEEETLFAGIGTGGATVIAEVAIAKVYVEKLHTEAYALVSGLGLLPRFLVHVESPLRGSLWRLLHAIALLPDRVGLSLPEDTAVHVPSETSQIVRVVGARSVAVVDARTARYNTARANPSAPLGLGPVSVYLVPPNHALDLRSGNIIRVKHA